MAGGARRATIGRSCLTFSVYVCLALGGLTAAVASAGAGAADVVSLSYEIQQLEHALLAKRGELTSQQAGSAATIPGVPLEPRRALQAHVEPTTGHGGGAAHGTPSPPAHAPHDWPPPPPYAAAAAAVGQRGGHTTDLWQTEVCVPVRCGAAASAPIAHDLHHGETAVGEAMDRGCVEYEIFNFMKNTTDTVHLTCAGCVPHTCAQGEHDCVPVYCEDQHGDLHGGHSTDPCEGGHHSEDGLQWWPFLLCCLITTVGVTGVLKSLGNGACFGKSVNPPFTVVMFFFGYLVSALCVQENELTTGIVETVTEHAGFTGILFESVLAWKEAHPHVILFVLLPPLLFEDASGMDYYIFRKVLMSSIILAGPGVGISMFLSALTTMFLFGFAEECVVEVDAASGVQMVGGAVENTVIDGVSVCDPAINHEWQAQQGPDGGLICMQCVEGSHAQEQLPVSVHLLLGGMLAATDPVAVCAVLNDLGCPAKLNYMIAGESLLNDGTAVVAFMVMQSVAGGCDTDAIKVLHTLIQLAGGGVLWGMFMASAAYNAIKHVRDPNIEITTLVFSTLATFWLAENVLHVSGVLGTVVFGVQTARTSFLAMDEHTQHANHAFWGEVGYVATSIIFILAGVKSRDKIASFVDNFAEDFEDDKAGVCAELIEEVDCITHHVCRWDMSKETGICSVNTSEELGEFHVGNQLFLNLILWVALGFIRAFVVALFSPFLKKIGYGLTLKEAAVMVWGGLRGAVSLSLALLIDGNHLIGYRAREMIFLQTTGIVTLTLVINGTTSGMVYKWLEVYPPNPFRPALATQGMRNIQFEMDKVINKLSGHWFHANADIETLVKLMPNFSGAHMHDGDLVDVEMNSMNMAWARSKDRMLIPACGPDLKLDIVKIVDHCSPVNFDVDSMDVADKGTHAAVPPNPYAIIRLIRNDTEEQSYETPIVKTSHSPSWADGAASHDFPLHNDANGELSPVRLHVDMYDNDFAGSDDKIGECTIDLTSLCQEGGEIEQTLELKAATTSNGSPRRTPRGTPVQCVGTVQVAVSCILSDVGKEVKFSLLRGQLQPLRAIIPGLSRTWSQSSNGSAGSGGGHGHGGGGGGHGGGHGHGGEGPSHIDKLRNIKRWLDESAEDIEHSFAMYDIMLAAMRSNFAHECGAKSISVEAFSFLNAAIGTGLDLNDINMQEEGDATAADKGTVEDARASRMKRMESADQIEGSSPLDACIDHVINFADNGLSWADATSFFAHRKLCAEMFLVLIDQLSELADNPDLASELGAFSTNAVECCARCKGKLVEMQLAAPNTFRTCHTLIGFSIVATEFQHRVHAYQDQGFFAEDMVAQADYVMLGRLQELAQYFDQSPILANIAPYIAPLQKNLRGHPVFYAFDADKRAAKLSLTSTVASVRGRLSGSRISSGDNMAVEGMENPMVGVVLSSEDASAARLEIEELYGRHNPEKLVDVDTLLGKYGEAKLLGMVRKKYGVGAESGGAGGAPPRSPSLSPNLSESQAGDPAFLDLGAEVDAAAAGKSEPAYIDDEDDC